MVKSIRRGGESYMGSKDMDTGGGKSKYVMVENEGWG